MPIAFTKVKKPFGWLGNMSAFPITWDGKAIRLEPSPMGAKMKAQANADKMCVVPMSNTDVLNMNFVVRRKLEQHPDLKKQLLETGDEVIIEDVTSRANGRHLFWGMALKDGEWIGDNILGKIWMRVRTELAAE